MQVLFKYDGKNYDNPMFTFFWNDEKDNFGIGLIYDEIYYKDDYNLVMEDLIFNYEKFKIDGTSFLYYTKENVYSFDLEDEFKLIPINKKFNHSIVLLDKNGNIKEEKYKIFECVFNGNNI